MTRPVLAVSIVAGLIVLPAPGGSQAASSACPPKLPSSLVSERVGAGSELVPPGAQALLLCSYHGLNPISENGRLEASRVVTASAELSWLTHSFDALPRLSGVVQCPFDDGSTLLALFEYAQPPDDPVSVGLNGCRIVQNGQLSRTASFGSGPALLARLESLLR